MFARKVQALAEAEGLEDRIRFLGECDELQLGSLYLGASVFVLPSYFEGYGMALTEAVARGLPVISTTGGAIPGTVPEGAGILVPPGDPKALGDAIASVVEDGSEAPSRGPSEETLRRLELSAAARRHASRLPDWEEQTQSFADALISLAHGRRRG